MRNFILSAKIKPEGDKIKVLLTWLLGIRVKNSALSFATLRFNFAGISLI
jgi:hypothetical protein